MTSVWRNKSKPTDLQRAVIRAAKETDPDKRVVGPQYAQAAKLLAERGYVTLQPLGEGFRVELSARAARKSWGLHKWRRFPPLRLAAAAAPEAGRPAEV
jgi:hypothetical protein